MIHKPDLWGEIKKIISLIDAEKCKTKKSNEKRMQGKMLYSPIDMNKAFKIRLEERGWSESRVSYWVTKDEKLIRKILTMSPSLQKMDGNALSEQAYPKDD